MDDQTSPPEILREERGPANAPHYIQFIFVSPSTNQWWSYDILDQEQHQ